MNTVLKFFTVVFTCVASFYVALLCWYKIYNLTILPLGAPHLSLLQVFGIHWFVQALTYKFSSKEEERSNEIKYVLGRQASYAASLLFSWFLCWLVFG